MTTNIVNVFEPAQFGVGDGATTQFQIGGPREVVTSIAPTGVWRQDWQGNQRLYPTPRTNRVWSSDDMTVAPWTIAAASLVPDSPGVFRFIESATNATHLLSQTHAINLPNTSVSMGFDVKPNGRDVVSVATTNSGNWVVGTAAVFTLSGDGVVNSGNGSIQALPDGWYRVRNLGTTSAGGAVSRGMSISTRLIAGGSASYLGDGVSGVLLRAPMFEDAATPGSYIPTVGSADATVTDYAASSTGLITMGQVPTIGAALTWTGSYTYEYRDDAPTLADRTVISQYANSPTLRQLIQNMDEYINPDTDFDAFYSYVWNVETAQGFGLDIWGRIVGVGRMLTIPGASLYLGYQEAYTAPTATTGAQPFDQAPFYTGAQSSQTFRLADDAYRKLILVRALANISDCTSPSLNRLLSNLFTGRGRCYVSDTGQMEFRYVFEFALEPYEIAILTQSGAIPKPAAVQANVLQVDLPTTFGFNEALMQPFGSGVFFTSSGLINAS